MMDRRLNAFCLGVPLEQQLKDGRDRLLIRNFLAGRVPEELRWRVTRGLPTPSFWGRFLSQIENYRESLQEFGRSKLVPDFIRVAEVNRLLEIAVTDQNTTAARIVAELVMMGRFLRWIERGPN